MTAVTIFFALCIAFLAACLYGFHTERLRPFCYGFVGFVFFGGATVIASFGAVL